ncbi:MAG: LD-carboxypeptidase, partial [Oscillospiraceae bacterium]|nr:LD-carboxypeptidase [Oscillospiraceae bacterium]
MNTLIKPPRLRPGDRIATVSPSWGCAGSPDARWRYELGVQRLKSEFGLEAAAMSHSLKGEDYLDTHPEARAEDLMTAFADPSIKGILANIGGSDSLRLLPYMDFDVIHNHPKVFIGYSDITSVHLMCLHAGLSTFYGANLLTTIADPQGLHPYSKHWFQKALFDV